jgi:hypothetical protein
MLNIGKNPGSVIDQIAIEVQVQEMVLEENGGIQSGGYELGMEFLGNGCGLEGRAGFHSFVEFLRYFHVRQLR